MDAIKKVVSAAIIAFIGLSCSHWVVSNNLKSDEFPMRVGAVHIYSLKGFTEGDSMVVTTVGTRRYHDHTIYIDSIAYFKDDSLKYSSEAYYAITSGYLYYYGDNAIGYLKDPIKLIDFPLYDGKSWFEDSEDTLGASWECVDYDTLWLKQGRYRAFCVQPSKNGDAAITRYWYAPNVGLVKFGKSSLSGPSRNQEICAFYPNGIPKDTTH